MRFDVSLVEVCKMPHGTGVEECGRFFCAASASSSMMFASGAFLVAYKKRWCWQGCDVLAKNDRGHTPFALCTDPEASQWCLFWLSISRSCCMLVESPAKVLGVVVGLHGS